MTPSNPYDGLIERLKQSAQIATTSEFHLVANDILEAAEALSRLTRDVEEAKEALFESIESDASLNLEGVLYDLKGPHNPNDGGVCARTIERVIKQLEKARATLTRLSRTDIEEGASD